MSKVMDYREISKQNRIKTYIVLGFYLCIYIFIGLLIDTIRLNQGDLTSSFRILITFEVFPIATVFMFGVGLVTILLSILMFQRIQLAGEKYIEVTADGPKEYKRLYNIIEELKIAGSMKYMPKIYIINADYMNAFASGWSEKNTMVAITRGLYEKLNYNELAAVMAHEMTHIRNEDVKLTLVIGVVTNLMLFVVDWFAFYFFRDSDSDGAKKARIILLIFHFILPIITYILQMWLSRSREYMADAGAVELVRDPQSLASALEKISGDYSAHNYRDDNNSTRRAAYIFEKGDSIFSTHPSIKNRINKLLGKN